MVGVNKRLLATLLCVLATLAARGQGIAFDRAAHLQRGVNLSMWYAQAADYSAARLTTYTTADDFKLVRSLGLDHVRLSINPEPLMLDGKPDALDPAAIARLDKTVAEITATGLVVILDIHPEMPYVMALGQGNAPATNFFKFWQIFATHYANTDPQKVYFEVLNEPHIEDSYRWAGIQSKAVEEIRAIAPHHTIIATGNRWGGVAGLVELQPLRDDNIIYSFHDYDPMAFTHQGATWSSAFLKELHGVPYPSTPENIAPLLPLETEDNGRQQLVHYGTERWDAKHVDLEITTAASWGIQHKVPVWCGEFGVFRTYAEPAARALWLHDMRVALESHHIGWSMWDYQGGFALVTQENGKKTADPPIVAALGLKPGRQ